MVRTSTNCHTIVDGSSQRHKDESNICEESEVAFSINVLQQVLMGHALEGASDLANHNALEHDGLTMNFTEWGDDWDSQSGCPPL
jgi:hypothetical protein